MQTIRFYEPKAPYYEFSNFYPAPIDVDGAVWPTVEHYFQAQKFATSCPEYVQLIRTCDTPNKAFQLARQRKLAGYAAAWVVDKRAATPLRIADAIEAYRGKAVLRADWDSVKEDVMRRALQAKFTQHPRLAKLLRATGEAPIVEASPRDAYWGEGKDGTGLNRLGQLLMEVRAQIPDL